MSMITQLRRRALYQNVHCKLY